MRDAAVIRTAALAAAAALCAGCTAIDLAPHTLAGTSWRVVAVNGAATPTAGDYSMRFGSASRFGARFGCNHMGGEYRLTGDTLTAHNIASTLMGCPEPAATFESQGSAILQQPMRVSFASKERMSLSNDVGTIALGRIS
jgi:heat shock protein HslJ